MKTKITYIFCFLLLITGLCSVSFGQVKYFSFRFAFRFGGNKLADSDCYVVRRGG